MAKEFDAVPSWDGDPSTFQTFEMACQWYEKTLKDTERRGAAARVWSRLTGPAKSVVRHLSPDEFDSNGGLSKLLGVLRNSPLQTLPIPDSFSKLERWHQLRRKDGETIPELIVREDDLFRELQTSLRRSRVRSIQVISVAVPADGRGASPTSAAAAGRGPSSTPASSSSAQQAPRTGEETGREATTAEQAPESVGAVEVETARAGFFEDELRGFRLLKAAGLTQDQRMQVLTSNVVSFEKIRQALRALFEDGDPAGRQGRRKNLWYTDDAEEEFFWQGASEESAWPWEDWGWDEDAYWSEWGDGTWDGGWQPAGEDLDEATAAEASGDGPDEESLVAEEQEAMALANEASKTLQEARSAIPGAKAPQKAPSPSERGKENPLARAPRAGHV